MSKNYAAKLQMQMHFEGNIITTGLQSLPIKRQLTFTVSHKYSVVQHTSIFPDGSHGEVVLSP